MYVAFRQLPQRTRLGRSKDMEAALQKTVKPEMRIRNAYGASLTQVVSEVNLLRRSSHSKFEYEIQGAATWTVT